MTAAGSGGDFRRRPQSPLSPSRLDTWLVCPRRYRMRYLDRPAPALRPMRAVTRMGVLVHQVLREFWTYDVSDRTPGTVRACVRAQWTEDGFRDPAQAARARTLVEHRILAYLRGATRESEPLGVERTVSVALPGLTLTGRVDRIDDRDGEPVVVDYKTGRRPPGADEARVSTALAVYAVAVTAVFRRVCRRVELHHVPTGRVFAHVHDENSLERKLAEVRSLARDVHRADAQYADGGADTTLFEPAPGPLCRWCEVRAHCPAGAAMGEEAPDWEGVDEWGGDGFDALATGLSPE